ncbi:MAG: hypothetical protein KGL53_16820, partial [Elusimicrobia bacterium]|nr:hypothetical protein [Elusimicrobiota bacterium]
APRGVADFLLAKGGGGDVLEHPNMGGFLEWRLGSSYRVAADMRVPHLFPTADFLELRQAFLDRAALGRLVGRYRPPFIVVPASDAGFPSIVEGFADYVPVFFDDASVLYADRGQRPDLVRAWKLDWVSPFRLVGQGVAELPDAPAARAALARMIAVAPHCLTTRQLAAQLALAAGDRPEAETQAKAILRDFPELPMGEMLLARARGGL